MKIKSQWRSGRKVLVGIMVLVFAAFVNVQAQSSTPVVSPSTNDAPAQAKKAFEEGMGLFDKNTRESYLASREKFLTAGRLYRDGEDRFSESSSYL